MDLLEDGIPLLKAKEDVLLDERELDARHLEARRCQACASHAMRHAHELLQGLELAVGLGQECLLVLALPEGGERLGLVPGCERVPGYLLLPIEHALDLSE